MSEECQIFQGLIRVNRKKDMSKERLGREGEGIQRRGVVLRKGNLGAGIEQSALPRRASRRELAEGGGEV